MGFFNRLSIGVAYTLMTTMNVLQLTQKLQPIYNLTPSTYKEWGKAIKPIAHLDVNDITEEIVWNYRVEGHEHLANSTLKTRIGTVRGIWEKARKWN